ncbi:WecB/TagA/CpsF family glycosyltransferase [Dethiothermospora halolimnae]|uniref:WecB/TagA/CpsF family glycosyltransferase n=1 Tax=Dethiothermospora halolimnae TaxID=3114390 RepID=UPI003CCB8735
MEENIKIFGVKINKTTLDGAINKVKEFLKSNDNNPKAIYTPNTEIVMAAKDDNFLRKIINDGDLVIADGIGLIYASKIKKRPLPERVTGFDLSIEMLKLANKEKYNVFLLGGKEGVAKQAKENIIKEYPNVNIVGFHNGYFKGTHISQPGHNEEKKVIEEINKSGAHMLFVGLGAPKQEKWIHENKDKLNCKVIIGNGGTMDILAGMVKRAPDIYQKLGLEWFYRLIKDPKRIKRQMVLPLFMFKILFSSQDVIE